MRRGPNNTFPILDHVFVATKQEKVAFLIRNEQVARLREENRLDRVFVDDESPLSRRAEHLRYFLGVPVIVGMTLEKNQEILFRKRFHCLADRHEVTAIC